MQEEKGGPQRSRRGADGGKVHWDCTWIGEPYKGLSRGVTEFLIFTACSVVREKQGGQTREYRVDVTKRSVAQAGLVAEELSD